jgi:hypothetical protein
MNNEKNHVDIRDLKKWAKKHLKPFPTLCEIIQLDPDILTTQQYLIKQDIYLKLYDIEKEHNKNK